MRAYLLSSSFLALALAVFPARAENISMSQVVLRGLDKATGRLSTMTVNVGETAQFGALDIYARVCYTRSPEETPENASFLEIVEKKPEGQAKLFSGWMFSSSPALSAMEHPVYDVWVLKCQGEKITPPKPEPLILENPIETSAPQPKVKITIEDEEETEAVPVPENAGEVTADPDITVQEDTPPVLTPVEEDVSAAVTVTEENGVREEAAPARLTPIEEGFDAPAEDESDPENQGPLLKPLPPEPEYDTSVETVPVPAENYPAAEPENEPFTDEPLPELTEEQITD